MTKAVKKDACCMISVPSNGMCNLLFPKPRLWFGNNRAAARAASTLLGGSQ